jgi:hypothetical protein
MVQWLQQLSARVKAALDQEVKSLCPIINRLK